MSQNGLILKNFPNFEIRRIRYPETILEPCETSLIELGWKIYNGLKYELVKENLK